MRLFFGYVATALIATASLVGPASADEIASESKPNIVVVTGDDIGWFNFGAN